MSQRLMGVESEYAVTALGPNGTVVPREDWVFRLMALARDELECLEGEGGSSLFLGNGSRFYVDHGLHPELCTPECTNPWDAVRYVKAGDLILQRLGTRLARESPELSEVLVYRGNVDYSGSGSTWGCHESYLHRADPEDLSNQIIPHLASRIVFAGAGGFESLGHACQFTVSARAPHIVRVVSGSSTHDRGIFHTKDESLCSGYHRLHLLCGDSVNSELALWLSLGSTALVVRMIENGARPGDRVQLRSPMRALHKFARDPKCEARSRLTRGAFATAITIQRHFLECAETRAGEPYMPPWAGEVCRVWRETLNALARDPQELRTKLDWAIKLELYKDRAKRRGFEWERLGSWRTALEALGRRLAQAGRSLDSLKKEDLVGTNGPLQEIIGVLSPRLARRKLSWDELDPLLRLRQELFEIDTRFAQLGDAGIFGALDRAGALAHKIPGVNRIEQATVYAPTEGRAHLRGKAVRKLARADARCVCDWQFVWNLNKERRLDLSDPLEDRVRWKKYQVPDFSIGPLSNDVFSLLEALGL